MRYFLMALLLTGCVNLTPVQEELLMGINDEADDIWISSEELQEILPSFAEIEPGVYKLVPRGMVAKMHNSPWCAPGASDLLRPKDWDCVEYAASLADVMQAENYAFGVASGPYKTRLYDRHMINVFIDQDKKIILYDPQLCQFVRQETDSIAVGY